MVSKKSFSLFFNVGRASALIFLSLLVANCQTMPTPDGYDNIHASVEIRQKAQVVTAKKVLPKFSSFLDESLSFSENEKADQKGLAFRKSGLSHYAHQMQRLHHHQWVTRLTSYVEAALPAVESYPDYKLVASGYTLNLASFFENELKNYQKIDSYDSYVLFLAEVDALKRNKKILVEI